MRWLVCVGVILAVILADHGVVKAPHPSMAALKWIVMIHTAEAEYHYDNERFATSLQELGPSGANMIERDLASGARDGYKFTLTGTPAGYAISAVPVQRGVSSRTYFSDQSMRIHVHIGPGTASADDPTLGETAPPQESDPVAPRRDKTNS
jgi:hypothetical protein